MFQRQKSMNYRPSITFLALGFQPRFPASTAPPPPPSGARGVRGSRAVPRRKHIHKTVGAKPLYITAPPHPFLRRSVGRANTAGVGESSSGRYVEFISTKPRETAAANHELRPITGIVTVRRSECNPDPRARIVTLRRCYSAG